jgi:tetratricopeptide (TPR) repeat protein
MQRQVVYLLMILVLAAGCSRQSVYNRVLYEADAMVEQDADSAHALLQTISDVMEHGDEPSQAHYLLLTAQTAYKRYQPVPADSLLSWTVDYYYQVSDRPRQCRALYYRAMPLYEQGQHDEALLLLKQGEELATGLHDVLYMSKYHESLCMVNDRAGCNDLMLEYAKLFLKDAIQLKDSILIARGFNHVSTAYTRLGEDSQAEKFMLKTLPYFRYSTKQEKTSILTNLGCTYHTAGNIALSKYYLELSLKVTPRSNTYAELGDVYADEGNMAEAEKYWQKALTSNNPIVVENTLTSIFNRHKQNHDDTKALEVLERLYNLKDSLSRVSEKEKIAEIQQKYDKQVVENKYYKALVWILGLALVGLFLTLAYYFYHRHVVRTFTSQLSIKEETILQAQQQIDLLKSSGEEHSEEIAALQRQITSFRHQTNERLGVGKALYEKILTGDSIHPLDDVHCLIEYYSIIHYEVYARWMDEYKALTPGQFVILILEEMGCGKSEVERIMHISHSAYRTAKSRLNDRRR